MEEITKLLRTLPLLASSFFIGNRNVDAVDYTPATEVTTKESQEAKVQLPKIFAGYDFDGSNKIDSLEAIEIFNDKAVNVPVSNVDANHDGKITKEEMNAPIEWFHRVSRLPNASPELKTLCLDTAADLYKQTSDKDSISAPLPRVIDRFDANKDREISLSEAINLYEDRTKKKLERDGQGQLTSGAFRQLIDAFNHPSTQLNIQTHTAMIRCFIIEDTLLKQYKAKYGPYDPDATYNKNIIIGQDDITKSN